MEKERKREIEEEREKESESEFVRVYPMNAFYRLVLMDSLITFGSSRLNYILS